MIDGKDGDIFGWVEKNHKKSKKCIQIVLYMEEKISSKLYSATCGMKEVVINEKVTEVVGDLALRPSLTRFWARSRLSSKPPYKRYSLILVTLNFKGGDINGEYICSII